MQLCGVSTTNAEHRAFPWLPRCTSKDIELSLYYDRLCEGDCVYGFQSLIDPFWDEAMSLRLFRASVEDADFTLSMFNAMLPRPLTQGFEETSFNELLGFSAMFPQELRPLPAYAALPAKYVQQEWFSWFLVLCCFVLFWQRWAQGVASKWCVCVCVCGWVFCFGQVRALSWYTCVAGTTSCCTANGNHPA